MAGIKDRIKLGFWIISWMAACVGYGWHYQEYKNNETPPPYDWLTFIPPTFSYKTLVIEGK